MKGSRAGKENATMPSETAVFAGGCFWHMQDTFQKLDGVLNVYAGYTGGHTKNPAYNEVVSNTTGHLESTVR
ncbi:peptide-methionine (S)-S-oxide reductase [Paenibacillus sp. R14(2021)]|uniref:peptide-methionine (S)-S-oxide reductase n=1 Tax=Paenibacillus sp. R14(2021) TaxID=2859228 RepID=UPI00280A6D71|nr:peptide-methionine (S)-S-oxide reductase [Paenibacillus sp. R14(2021)]